MLRNARQGRRASRLQPSEVLSETPGCLNLGTNAFKKRIVFVIPHLGAGGAQRVLVNAANVLAERDIDVHVLVVNPQPESYQLDSRVSVRSRGPHSVEGPALMGASKRALGKACNTVAAMWLVVRRAGWLRNTIREIQPNAVLSFLTTTNILTILATRGLCVHVVISERNDPRLQRPRRHLEWMRRIVYRWADVVTANSQGALSAMETFAPRQKLAFLPNPVTASGAGDTIDLTAPTIVTVGRLVEQKGLDVLLSAWAKASTKIPEWRLAIVGDGPLRKDLQSLTQELGIAGKVDWYGYLGDPLPLLRAAKFFVLTSRFEGTPNALLEAMACGLPSVIADASPGPRELVSSGSRVAGLIVPVEDAESTAGAIVTLATDERLRHELGSVARERSSAYAAERVIDVWLELLRCR